MIKALLKPTLGLTIGLLAMGCSSTGLLLTAPTLSYQNTSPRTRELSDDESKQWGHLDLLQDTVPGMSVNRAYEELIKKKKGQPIIVAVIDSGIDLAHEDIQDVLWVNPGEKADGIDNDGNGYVDDIHGYNFLGASYHEQLEFTRILRLKLGDESLQKKAKAELDAKLPEAKAALPQIQQIEQFVSLAHQNIQKKLGKEYYSLADLQNYTPQTPQEEQLVGILMQVLGMGEDIPSALADLQEGIAYYESQLSYNLNVDFDGRKPVGDNPYDFSDTKYGNGDPNILDADESHGTHVAGIIAANRTNKKGVKGVAQAVKIMSIRAVPDGDEYDKDIANAIRYAVDNGAKVINASFGKKFSPNAEWVNEALKYAASKDVLFVHAAGNDGLDLDDLQNSNFPNDHLGKNAPELVDTYLTVGALSPVYGSEMIASFSNYGKSNVDVFAPGDKIYSTMPGNDYDFQGGTSMAAPAVAGIAGLIRSYFPQLTAAEVKKIIMDSGLSLPIAVVVGEEEKTLDQISKSGKIANLYNALILASDTIRKKN